MSCSLPATAKESRGEMALYNRQLLARLHLDLDELQSSPYPGVDVVADERDMRRMCLLLTPPAGPWKGLRLHFNVTLPENWPAYPPQIQSSVIGAIDHPNVFADYVCCDLLKVNFQAEQGYTGGYTPALTLRGLFLQFLTFFSSQSVDQEYGGSVTIGDVNQMTLYVAEPNPFICLSSPPSLSQSRRGTSKFACERAWNEDPSEEVTVYVYDSPDGPVIQSTKVGMQFKPPLDRVMKLSFPNARYTTAVRTLANWRCRACKYGSPEMAYVVNQTKVNPHHQKLSAAALSRVCLLNRLNGDILYELASHLPTEALLAFSTAYQRMQTVVKEGHLLLQRELRCFYLRTPLRSAILGIGIERDARARTLHSEFDWISQDAFIQHGIRKSITKEQFSYFLPLAFGRLHFQRALPAIWQALNQLDLGISSSDRNTSFVHSNSVHSLLVPGPSLDPIQSVRVLLKFMNNIVVSLMKSCDTALAESAQLPASMSYAHSHTSKALLHASEKAIVAYCQLFHLLIMLCGSNPDILTAATRSVLAFVEDGKVRHKNVLPDIGEFIVLCSLVLALPPVTMPGTDSPALEVRWTHLNGPTLEEVLIRNARWVLRDLPCLEVYETGASDFRLAKTFHHSRTSLRLLMFQITFLDLIAHVPSGHPRSENLAHRLEMSYGFPVKLDSEDKSLPETMVEQIKHIYAVSGWHEFFERVKYGVGSGWDRETLSEVLRDCMKESGQRGYHQPVRGRKLQDITRQRRAMDDAAGGK